MFDGDVDKGIKRHARKYGEGGFTCSQLSKGLVLRAVAAYCHRLGKWKINNKDIDESKVTHLVNRSLPYKINFFKSISLK